MSEAAAAPVPAVHPVGLVVTDDLKRSRLTVFFRLLLAVPHFVWLELWAIVACVALLAAWFAAIFTGRVPDRLHGFLARYLRYTTHVYAYVLLLGNPFPPFSGRADYPVDLRVHAAQEQGRVTVLFRLVLAIPALILASVFRTVNEAIAFLSWFYAIFTGHMNGGMRDLSAWLLRYELQTYAYLFMLTGSYPSLAGAPTAGSG
jgi:Domain of unknown function (DUF4389)